MYNNPFRILTPEQIGKLNVYNLKSLKNLKEELIKQIDQSESGMLVFADQKYSKKQALQLLEPLDQDLALHLKIYKNTPLFAFLEKGELSFFASKTNQNNVIHDFEHKTIICSYIAAKLNTVTAELLNNPDSSTPGIMQQIADFTSRMNAEQKDFAYSQALSTIETRVDNLVQNYPHPFAARSGLQLKSNLDHLIRPNFYESFKYLPSSFEASGKKYASWCHNEIVNNALRREPNIAKFRKEDLQTISKAQNIALNVATSESFKLNAQRVKQLLASGLSTSYNETITTTTTTPTNTVKAKTATYTNPAYTNKTPRTKPKSTYRSPRKSKTSSWGGIKIAGISILVFVKFCLIMTKCGSMNSRSNNNSSYTQNNQQMEQMIKRMESQRKNRVKKQFKTTTERLSGDKSTYWNAKLLRSEPVNNVIELDYEVDVFPTTYNDFYTLIPQDVREKYTNKKKDFVVKFTSKDHPKNSFTHRFKAMLTPNVQSHITYDRRKNDKGNFLQLMTKRLPKEKILKGSITKFRVNTGEQLSKELFEISTSSTSSLIKKKSNSGNTPPPPPPEPQVEEVMDASVSIVDINQKFERWKDYKIHNISNQYYKDIILNNFNQIAYKKLKEQHFYTLNKTASYTPTLGNEINLANNSVKEKTSHLTFRQTSMEDDVAYLSANGENFQIRYFVNYKTKKIFGMHMATLNPNGQIGELIEVFF